MFNLLHLVALKVSKVSSMKDYERVQCHYTPCIFKLLQLRNSAVNLSCGQGTYKISKISLYCKDLKAKRFNTDDDKYRTLTLKGTNPGQDR